jgi:Undecaprenyl-phosphate glucose phosphotransferase
MTVLDGSLDLSIPSAATPGASARSAADASNGLSASARAVAFSLAHRPMSTVLFAGIVRLIELAGILLAGVLSYEFYAAPAGGTGPAYGILLGAGALAAVFSVQAAGGYSIASLRRGALALPRIIVAWSGLLAVFAVAAFLSKSGADYSRMFVASWYVGGLVVLIAVRIPLGARVRDLTARGRFQRNAVIVGGGSAAAELIAALAKKGDNDIRICGIFDDRQGDRSPPTVAGYPRLGNIGELVAFARIARIDLLIVSLPIAAESRLLAMLKQLWVLPVDIRLSAHTNKLKFRPRAYSFIGGVPFLDVFDRPIRDWDRVSKRIFDLVFASLALVALSPVLLATMIAIRLDSPGPVIFRQKRYGFNNEVIDVLKFRSMYHHFADPTAKQVVTRNDPRVTKVGRFIRKASIDELPQLINVLRGSLSLVGPRPHAVNGHMSNRLFEEVVDGYFARHRVKPGVTGWAQISGWRGEIDSEEKIRRRVEYDLEYIENWSVLFDLKILFMTPFRLLSAENAY